MKKLTIQLKDITEQTLTVSMKLLNNGKEIATQPESAPLDDWAMVLTVH